MNELLESIRPQKTTASTFMQIGHQKQNTIIQISLTSSSSKLQIKYVTSKGIKMVSGSLALPSYFSHDVISVEAGQRPG